MTAQTADDNLMNHPYVRTKAAVLAENACTDEREGCTLLRAAALLLATVAANGENPDRDLEVLVEELATDARMLMAAMDRLDAITQPKGFTQ